jgi:hypothetical protein
MVGSTEFNTYKTVLYRGVMDFQIIKLVSFKFEITIN